MNLEKAPTADLPETFDQAIVCIFDNNDNPFLRQRLEDSFRWLHDDLRMKPDVYDILQTKDHNEIVDKIAPFLYYPAKDAYDAIARQYAAKVLGQIGGTKARQRLNSIY
ncbi:hypothetical protein [uncultured Thiodictyon sp.]|uniref:hypothetical protein n=1 Tax=uncultured Thiodictyon sp. TaxID=1846217 RepID=UPI0025D0F35B|nr:hypothetical protein [uncultured Thiodictyon sp.]